MKQTARICIIGAGVAGLSCAYHLEKKGFRPLLFEASDSPGGRVKSFLSNGYCIDNGFQVLLSSYFELKKIVSFQKLNPAYFPTAIRIRYQGRWHVLHNPLRNPLKTFSISKLPFTSFSEVVSLGSLYLKSALRSRNPLFDKDKGPILPFLKQKQIGEPLIEALIKPFFSSVFLDEELDINTDIFLWILHFFVEGKALLPSNGMQALPVAMANALKETQINYNSRVAAVEGQQLFLEGGQVITADKIVLATNGSSAKELIPSLPELEMKKAVTLYFSLDKKSLSSDETMIHVCGDEPGPITSLAPLSAVQPTYAPKGKQLIAASIIGRKWQEADDETLVKACLEQLKEWFREPISRWSFLKCIRIQEALPRQNNPPCLQWSYAIDRQPDIYLCGEYVDNSSLNGAVASGRKLADVVEEGLKRLATQKSAG